MTKVWVNVGQDRKKKRRTKEDQEEYHKEYMKEYNYNMRQIYKEQGLCTNCGKERDSINHVTCGKCRGLRKSEQQEIE